CPRKSCGRLQRDGDRFASLGDVLDDGAIFLEVRRGKVHCELAVPVVERSLKIENRVRRGEAAGLDCDCKPRTVPGASVNFPADGQPAAKPPVGRVQFQVKTGLELIKSPLPTGINRALNQSSELLPSPHRVRRFDRAQHRIKIEGANLRLKIELGNRFTPQNRTPTNCLSTEGDRKSV